jgi:hypothetical protein
MSLPRCASSFEWSAPNSPSRGPQRPPGRVLASEEKCGAVRHGGAGKCAVTGPPVWSRLVLRSAVLAFPLLQQR